MRVVRTELPECHPDTPRQAALSLYEKALCFVVYTEGTRALTFGGHNADIDADRALRTLIESGRYKYVDIRIERDRRHLSDTGVGDRSTDFAANF